MKRPWTADEDHTLRAMRSCGASMPAIARALGRNYDSVRNRIHSLGGADAVPRGTADAPKPDERVVTGERSPQPPTVDQLLTQCGIDLEEWEVDRCKVNKWEVGAKVADVHGAEQLVTEPLYQLTVWLKKRRDAELRQLREQLLADLRALPPTKAPRHARVPEADAHMFELDAFDLHFGKLSWSQETREDYDLKIAAACFREAIEDLIRKAAGYQIDRVLFPVGNDLLQADNLTGTTTGGTPQDTDSRYPKAFRHAVTAMTWAIRRLREIAPVHVPIIPGNHDRLAAFHVGEVLAALFHDDATVVIDNTPNLRKYVRYGSVLLGLTHGSEERPADLPLIMAREEPRAWAECAVHEWHVGHLHKSKETRFTAGDTFNGVGVRIITALTAADAWHHARGYVKARRAAEAFLWSHAAGYAGHFASQPVIAAELRAEAA